MTARGPRLETARVNRRVAGVVAWVPIDDVALAESWLDRWSAELLDLLASRQMTFDVSAESPQLLGRVPSLAPVVGPVLLLDR